MYWLAGNNNAPIFIRLQLENRPWDLFWTVLKFVVFKSENKVFRSIMEEQSHFEKQSEYRMSFRGQRLY